MAESPAHRVGQIIGEIVEVAVEALLLDFAKKHDLFLDRKGPRPARPGNKCSWKDAHGNTHDLDYVLERGGSPTKIGTPVAFIESAWRSYTKHSRAKAQEIQGAVLPLLDTHRMVSPFIGVVLAGVFTEGALAQLRSLGFTVLFFPVAAVVKAFATATVNIAFGERTSLDELAAKVTALEALSAGDRAKIAGALLKGSTKEVAQFMAALEAAVTRQVASVRILPVHGYEVERLSVGDAISFIADYSGFPSKASFQRFEIQVLFNNGNQIDGQFRDKQSAIDFLEMFRPPVAPAST